VLVDRRDDDPGEAHAKRLGKRIDNERGAEVHAEQVKAAVRLPRGSRTAFAAAAIMLAASLGGKDMPQIASKAKRVFARAA
jgi:hypothetical protein